MSTDNTQDGAEPSPASAGSVASIDAHELMCELHHIAGSEQHDPDVRRTASDAESAIARLIDWVHQLQVNAAEREAIEGMAAYFDTRGNITLQAWGSLLRVLLMRWK